MKKIYITLIILTIAMLGMAYLYFSRLNRETSYNEISLHAAAANAGLIFCVENDKSIFEILKGQDFFEKLTGKEKFSQLMQLRELLTAKPALNNLIAHKNIFIGFTAGKSKEIDYLISTQLNNEEDKPLFMESIKAAGIKTDPVAGQVSKLTLNDSTLFYLKIEKNLILLSNTATTIETAVTTAKQQETAAFASFIKSSTKLSKNSLGHLYIDFNRLPMLIKSILPGKLSGNLSVLANQNSFSALNYNFSKERVFFNGATSVNDPKNYLSLFAGLEPQRNSIDNILPASTANFRLFSIPSYKIWKASLDKWFVLHKEEARVQHILSRTNNTYRLKADDIFPVYFKNQLICFQLASGENIGAINLSNGDKVKQLLLDISENNDQEIRRLKVEGLLYCYFGEPLKHFGSPYYTIIDNYMIFSNQAGSLRNFLSSYQGNHLLINTPDYISLYDQISANANVTIYANRENSSVMARNSFYTTYYKHFISGNGIGNFSSFIYQLSGDKGNFQTNFLINTLYKIDDDNLTPD